MKVLGMEVSEGFGQALATLGVILGAIVILRLFFKIDLIEKVGGLLKS